MIKRKKFVGTWVSEQEKTEILELAKGMNISVSNLIRHRVIRPMMTLPEAISNLKIYIDIKINKFEHNISEIIKNQLFNREPVRRMIIEEYSSETILKEKPLVATPSPEEYQAFKMRKVLVEMQKKVQSGTKMLEKIPEKEITKRPKTDPEAFIAWKIKSKNKK